MRTNALQRVCAVLALVLYTIVVAKVVRDPDGLVYRNLSPWVWLFSGVPVEATYIPTPIKSIQQVAVSVASGSTSASASLGVAIVTGNALLVFQGMTTDDGGNAFGCADWMIGTIASTTSVSATKGSTCTTNNNVYNATVVEYLGQFVKSQGANTIAIADGSTNNTASISSVTTTKTILAYSGQKNNVSVSTVGREDFVNVVLSSSTVVTATRGATSTNLNNLIAAFNYVEFK